MAYYYQKITIVGLLLFIFFIRNTLSAQNRRVIFSEYYCYESVVFDSTYSNDMIFFFRDPKRFTPSDGELRKAEEIIVKKFNSLNLFKIKKNINRQIKLKDLRKFRRQYYGIITKNGDYVVVIYFLNFNRKRKAKKIFKGWDHDYIFSTSPWFSNNSFLLAANLTKNSLSLEIPE